MKNATTVSNNSTTRRHKPYPQRTESTSMSNQIYPSDSTPKVKEAIKSLTKGKNIVEPFIYQSSEPVFVWEHLVEQFLVHVFVPFSFPYLYKRYGWQTVRNQFGSAVPVVLLMCLYWVIIILLILNYEYLSNHGVSGAEVGVSLMGATFFRLAVATKYSSMTPEEYIKFITCKDSELFKQYQKNAQLITGWLSIDMSFCAHEATLALHRMGFMPGSSEPPPCFEISTSEILNWSSVLGEHSAVLHHRECSHCKEESVNVDVSDLMALIIANCDQKVNYPENIHNIYVMSS
jgi:hypothetical protein